MVMKLLAAAMVAAVLANADTEGLQKAAAVKRVAPSAAVADAPLAGQGAKFGLLFLIAVVGVLVANRDKVSEVFFPKKASKTAPFLAVNKGSDSHYRKMEAGQMTRSLPTQQKPPQTSNAKPPTQSLPAKKTDTKPKTPQPSPRPTPPAGPNCVEHLVSACSGHTTAYARMEPTRASEPCVGRVDFEQVDGKTTLVKYHFKGLASGLHGLHVVSQKDETHTDVGNVKANAEGVAKGQIKLTNLRLTGKTSVVGYTAKIYNATHLQQALAVRGTCVASGTVRRS